MQKEEEKEKKVCSSVSKIWNNCEDRAGATRNYCRKNSKEKEKKWNKVEGNEGNLCPIPDALLD